MPCIRAADTFRPWSRHSSSSRRSVGPQPGPARMTRRSSHIQSGLRLTDPLSVGLRRVAASLGKFWRGRAAALTIGLSLSVLAISGVLFLLLAPSAACAEEPSYDKGVSTHAIAMHGQPALAADFSRLPYADPQAVKGGRVALAYQGTFDSLNPY